MSTKDSDYKDILPGHIVKWLEDHQYNSEAMQALQATVIRLGSTDKKKVLIVEKSERMLRDSDRLVVRVLDVAEQLHMSERSMKRKLQECNTCFREMLDEERKLRYFLMCVEGILTAEQMAQQLGYSDCKSLYRARQRWTAE